jgi:hypothetical protein
MNRNGSPPAEDVELCRLDGRVLSLGCQGCPLLKPCGGQTRVGAGWSCLVRCIGCDRARCDRVCLGKPATYIEAVGEVNGFGAEDIGPLYQVPGAELPRYVPVLQHEYSRKGLLRLPWVAIPLHAALSWTEGMPALKADTAERFREIFHLRPETRVLLLGTGKDDPIERYWEARRVRGLPAALAALGWSMAVAPNYSLFLDDPRPQHFHNRKRSLICAKEWSAERISTVPYLHGVCEHDYGFWLDFLTAHPEVRMVAKEFQTGAAKRSRGLWHIEQMAHLQDSLGRELHPLAIGAAQYRVELAARFSDWTIIDSMPFIKAVHRRRAYRGERRIHWKSELDASVDALFSYNAAEWGRWIEDLVASRPWQRREFAPRIAEMIGQIPLPFAQPM